MTKLKNSNSDKTQKLKFWQNKEKKWVELKKNQILTKLQDANFDKTPKLKLGEKIQCSNCEKKTLTQWWPNMETQITQIKTVVIVTVVTVVTVVVIVISFSKNNSTPWQPMRYSQGSFLQFSRCFVLLLLSALVERFSISYVQNFYKHSSCLTEKLNSAKSITDKAASRTMSATPGLVITWCFLRF